MARTLAGLMLVLDNNGFEYRMGDIDGAQNETILEIDDLNQVSKIQDNLGEMILLDRD
jgi:hypothetical protein